VRVRLRGELAADPPAIGLVAGWEALGDEQCRLVNLLGRGGGVFVGRPRNSASSNQTAMWSWPCTSCAEACITLVVWRVGRTG
jgi:hypothetical protein